MQSITKQTFIDSESKVFKLGEVFKTTSGGTPSRNNPNYFNGNIPWVKSGELESNIITDTEEKISEEAIKNSSAKVFPKGTLLIALYGATIGKLARLGIDAATNQAVCGIYEHKEHDIRYLYWFLFHKRRDLIKAGIGGAQPNISQTILKNLEITLPDKVTQQAIIFKIEELFSELDKSIETLRLAQQQLKTYRQAVLKWAFEGKLTEEWRKENGTTVRVPAGSQEVQMIPSGLKPKLIAAEPLADYKIKDSKNRQLPDDWKLVLLKELAILITDGDHQAPPKAEEGIPFITISNVDKTNFKIDFTDTFLVSKDYYYNLKENRKPQKGDVLYTVTGSFGIPILVDYENEFCFQRHIGLIRPLITVNQKWLYYLLQSPEVYNQAKQSATGTAQKTVALNSLRNFQVPLCSFEEQSNVVQVVETRLSVADKMEESIIQSIQQAEALRQSILKKAFEGKLC